MIPFPVLRSVMRCAPDDPEEGLAANLFMLRRELEAEGVDKEIIRFLGDIYDRTHIVPAWALTASHFKALEKKGDGRGLPAQHRLEALSLANLPLDVGAEFRVALDTYREEIMKETLSKLLLEASAILTVGADRTLREKGKAPIKIRLHGVDHALTYIQDTLTGLNRRLHQGVVEGSFKQQGDQLLADYDRWESDPSVHIGVRSGIERIDVVHRGLKKGDLGLVLGFVGHMKTTFCLNWLYKAAVWYGHNVAIVSLETQVDALRNLLYVMHSTHKRFERDDGEVSLGGIDYDRLTTGTLSPEDKQQLAIVVNDLQTNPSYGEMYFKEPEGSITIEQIKTWAEGLHKVKPLDLIVVDYLGLVDAGPGQYSVQEYSNLNLVIRQAKKSLAMSFANGRGIAVLSPHQANREGLKDAEKAGGRYKLTALAGTPEAERSADVVYSCFLDNNLRAARELAVGHLKGRHVRPIEEMMKLFANPATRTIADLDLVDPLQEKIKGGILGGV